MKSLEASKEATLEKPNQNNPGLKEDQNLLHFVNIDEEDERGRPTTQRGRSQNVDPSVQKQPLHFLKIEDEGRLYRKKHVSNPCRDSAMHMVTAQCNRDQSMRSSKHLSQLNSLNQQPFKNEESSFDLVSTELHGPNLHLENLEDDRDGMNSVHQRARGSNLDATNLALPMHRPQKNV